MAENVANGNRFSDLKLRNVSGYIIVERELLCLDKQHNGHGRELFRERGSVKNRTRRDRDAMIEIGHSVSPFENDATLVDDSDGAARRISFVELRKDIVDSILEGSRNWGLGTARQPTPYNAAERRRGRSRDDPPRYRAVTPIHVSVLRSKGSRGPSPE